MIICKHPLEFEDPVFTNVYLKKQQGLIENIPKEDKKVFIIRNYQILEPFFFFLIVSNLGACFG